MSGDFAGYIDGVVEDSDPICRHPGLVYVPGAGPSVSQEIRCYTNQQILAKAYSAPKITAQGRSRIFDCVNIVPEAPKQDRSASGAESEGQQDVGYVLDLVTDHESVEPIAQNASK